MQSRSQQKHMTNICNKLYHKIEAFICQFGYPPSLREMGQMMDVDSTSQVRVYLNRLESWGWVKLTSGKGRTLQLTRPTEIESPIEIRERASVVSDRMAKP